jgi:hypothetical protein
MPEKTHLRSIQARLGGLRCALLFELHRRPVAERRMQPLPIVIAVQKFLDVGFQILQVAIVPAVNLLLS